MKKILLILSAIFLLFVGCKKDDVIEASKLEIKNGIVERGWDFLKLSGVYSYPQELVGIKLYLSESSNMSGAKSYNCVLEGRDFACEAADLKDGMKYYYYLEYDNGYEKIMNKVDFVSTVAKPVLTTENAVNITITSAVLSGSVTNSDAANEIKTKGFCWGTSQNPGIESNVTTNGSGVGSYTSNIYNLSPNTTYFYRTYLTTNYGTIYGEQKNFKTVEVTLPTVTTDEITEITSNSAQCGANVTSDGNGTVRARGVCWSASPNPTISDNDGMTTDGEGAGIFTSNLTNLNENTIYYVRAYATNSAGTGYGEEKSFNTVEVTLPTVTTDEITEITSNSAQCGANVTSDGNGTVRARGVCWSTSPNPTISDNGGMTTDGDGTGSFTSNLTNLNENTIYYVRAYATNSAGTGYGEEKSFRTVEEVTLPTVTTDEITEITSNSAQCAGNVTSDGNGTVRARGVCWGTSPNPTVNDNETIDGDGTGSFTSNLTNLNENTIYYVRAYATNSAGTGYGEEKTFKTLGCINGHEFVDLGLPSGLKWATCNVGADTPEDYGDYFAWGETSPKAEYTDENSIADGLTISELQSQGYIDGSGNLTPLHDAATANWGGSWRMPTIYEMQELVDYCEWEWTQVNGVNGSRVIGPNGSCIFLPAAGYRYGTSLYNDGSNGHYWSSSPFDSYDHTYAYFLYFIDGYENVSRSNRYGGQTVRPITE